MPQFAVTAVGPDRPGLLARVTGRLREAGADLADSMTTILGGHCAMILLVDAPETADAQTLQADIALDTADVELTTRAQALGPGSPSMPATHVLNVHGPDRPGIAHDVTSLLSDRGVNVTDATGRRLDGEQPVYALQLEIAAGEPDTADELVGELRSRAPDLEVHAEPLEVATF
jgi:glycine cleavage system transcriptional repressor